MLQNPNATGILNIPSDVSPDAPDSVTVNISSVQLSNSNSSPIELLPAPGAGLVYVLQQYVLWFVAGGTPYTFAGNMFIDMGGFTQFNLGNQITGSSVIRTGGGQSATLTPNSSVSLLASANPTLGDGTMTIKLFYNIESA